MFYGLILALLHISVTFFICRLGDMSLAHVGGVFLHLLHDPRYEVSSSHHRNINARTGFYALCVF